MSRSVWRRGLLSLGAVALGATLAWWANRSADAPTTPPAGRAQAPVAGPLPAVMPAPSTTPAAAAIEAPGPDRPAAPVALPRAPAALAAVPVTVSLPRTLQVGEQAEMAFSVGANAGAGEVSFTVQFDPGVVQVRAGTEGDWAAEARAPRRFVAEISPYEDRIQVHSAVSGARRAGGSVALVQFQAVAPGTTSVIVSDVSVSDAAGQPVPFSMSSSNVQLTVESTPTQWAPRAAAPPFVPVEQPAPELVETGD